jgi:hypothetical protein
VGDRRFDSIGGGEPSSIPPRALGKIAGDVGRLRQEVAALRTALAAGIAESTRLAASMRPKFESLNDEITGVGRRAVRTGKIADALNAEKRSAAKLRRRLILAVVLGFAGTIGAGAGALALKSCLPSFPAPAHEAK